MIELYAVGSLLACGIISGLLVDDAMQAWYQKTAFFLFAALFSWFAVGVIIGITIRND